MRIVLLSGSYPPDMGGPALQTRDMAVELRRKGHDVIVVTLPRKESWKRFESKNEYWVCFLRLSKGKSPIVRVINKAKVAFILWKVITRFRAEIVHSQTPSGSFGIVPALICRLLGIKGVTKYTADPSWEKINTRNPGALLNNNNRINLSLFQKAKYLCFQFQDRMVFKSYHKVWVTSPFFKDRLRDTHSLSEDRIWLYPNFIMLDKFMNIRRETWNKKWFNQNNSNKSTTLLLISRIVPWKRIDIAIKALGQLDSNFHMRIVGNSVNPKRTYYEEHVRELTTRLGLQDRVTFVGQLDAEAVSEEYKRADIFLLPSQYEPFGIVLIEAMASGVPIVATRTGGIPYVVGNGRAAALVPPCNVEALVAEVKQLKDNPSRTRRKVLEGLQLAKRYDLREGCDALLQLYNGLLSMASSHKEAVRIRSSKSK